MSASAPTTTITSKPPTTVPLQGDPGLAGGTWPAGSLAPLRAAPVALS
jgi:hypothetical protein